MTGDRHIQDMNSIAGRVFFLWSNFPKTRPERCVGKFGAEYVLEAFLGFLRHVYGDFLRKQLSKELVEKSETHQEQWPETFAEYFRTPIGRKEAEMR